MQKKRSLKKLPETEQTVGPQELEALRSLNWITNLDMGIFSVLLVGLLVLGANYQAQAMGLHTFLKDPSSCGILLLQLVLLQLAFITFRGSFFTLQVLVATRTLPSIAARMAIPYLQDTPQENEFDKNLLPSVMSSWKFLREVGWFTVADYVYGCLSILAVVTSAVLIYLGRSVTPLILLLQIWWVIVLVYRQAHFVLQALADLKMLPVEASRLIILFQRKV